MTSSTAFFRRFRRKQSSEKGRRGKSEEENTAPYFGDPNIAKPEFENKQKKSKYAREQGEQILLTFIRTRLGNRAENLAVRLMNKTPLKDGSEFIYSINQSTEGKLVEAETHLLSSNNFSRIFGLFQNQIFSLSVEIYSVDVSTEVV